MSSAAPLRDRQLIEVARVVIVDRAPEQGPQVAMRGGGVLALSSGLGLRRSGGGEVGFEATLLHGLASQLLQKRTRVDWQSESSKCEVRCSKCQSAKFEMRSVMFEVRERSPTSNF